VQRQVPSGENLWHPCEQNWNDFRKTQCGTNAAAAPVAIPVEQPTKFDLVINDSSHFVNCDNWAGVLAGLPLTDARACDDNLKSTWMIG